MLAKVDIKSAFRLVPVHKEDRQLLGMMWDGALYVDCVLPFGLCSATKIFTSIADALEWRLKEEGVEVVFHYLDDFLIVAPPDFKLCEVNLCKLLALFKRLHIPVAPDKLEGPATTLVFLGIELDTIALILRLPEAKREELKSLVAKWLGKKFCQVKDLQSLVGKLQHASRVVRPGRTFLRRMFDLLKGIPQKQQFVRLNTSFRSDLMWWHTFLESWNGVSMMRDGLQASPDHHVTTDASGSFGCGAWWGHWWLQYKWPEGLESWSIAIKELVPIIMACAMWGWEWQGSTVLVHCDNKAVVSVLNGCAKDTLLVHLLRCIFFIAAHYELSVRAAHIPGKDNMAADAISRDNLPLFHSQVPQAAKDPSPTGRTSNHPATGLDVHNLVPVVQELFAAGIALSTKKVYGIGELRYNKFCTSFDINPYPTSERVLLLFVSHLHQEGLAPGTVKSYLAVVRYEQICKGLGNPAIHAMPQLEYVLKGTKQLTPASGRKRLPITPPII